MSHADQGNNLSLSNLPHLSISILKVTQNKEYVDFNSLMPISLYDYTLDQPTLNFQINPHDLSNNTVALTSSLYKRVKINSLASWLQA